MVITTVLTVLRMLILVATQLWTMAMTVRPVVRHSRTKLGVNSYQGLAE